MSRVIYADGINPPECSEILPGLYIGRRPYTYVGYDLVISCERHLARVPIMGYDGLTLHCPMDDDDSFALDESAMIAAAALAAHVLMSKGRVLVHCTGGLNRSGVVTAGVVVAMTGCTGREAVDLLRAKHDPYVLCNRAFERAVTGEELPTAETSAFGENP